MRTYFKSVRNKIILATLPIQSHLAALTQEERDILQQSQRTLDKGYAGPSDAILEFGKRAFGTSNRPRTPMEIVASIIQIALSLLGIIAVALIVYSGFRWITAAGDPDKIKNAKKIIVQSIIALFIVLSAFAITQFIINAFTRSAL